MAWQVLIPARPFFWVCPHQTQTSLIGAMMRKLVQVSYGVLKSGQTFRPGLHGA